MKKTDKAKVLVFTRYFYPLKSSGGPVKSLLLLINGMAEKYDFYIVSGLHEYDGTRLACIGELDTWIEYANYKILYPSSRQLKSRSLRRLIREVSPDTLYFNSFWDLRFSFFPFVCARNIPVKKILAPRGEFNAQALSLKFLKKKIFLRLVKLLRLYKGVQFHSTSIQETRSIKSVFWSNEVCEANNFTTLAFEWERNEKKASEGYLNLVFVGRITRMKNLEYAIDALRSVKTPVNFSVYGPIEDVEYWHLCKKKIEYLSPNIKFKYCGSIEYEEVRIKLSESDLLFLPTLGENFGHVIFESLSVGTPVLISDQTPWINLEKRNLGWALELRDKSKFVQVIHQYHLESNNQKLERRKKCIRYCEGLLASSKLSDDYDKMFRLVKHPNK